MIQNGWESRLVYGFALWLANIAHPALVSDISNTPAGMLVYHGTAAWIDLMLLACASSVLYGRLADDIQNLCMLSMAVNAAGWFLYLAYAPPITYNYAIGVLGYVQLARLFTMGLYGTDRVGGSLFRGHAFGR